jgi:hypothetical protein
VIDLFRNPKAAANYWRGKLDRTKPAESPTSGLPCLPVCEVDTILPETESIPVTLIDYRYTCGDMPADELMLLCRIVRYRKPSVIFEIGTYLGGTTLQLTANSQAQVYTLDLPPRDHPDYVKPEIRDPESDVYPDQPGIRFRQTSYKKRIHQLFGDSLSFDFRPYHGKVDLVFIDGSHHHEFVLSDSRNALKMVSPRGIVVWHDYASYAPGVVGVLDKLAKIIPLKQVAGTSLVVHQR